MVDGRRVAGRNRIREVYESIRWCWVFFALASLVLQATRTVDISDMHAEILDKGELALTLTFDVEIVIRVLAYLPDWRKFFYRGQNVLDLLLAIGSSIIQIPAIHRSPLYPWLTIFQLTRFYRVILEIPRMKPLLVCLVPDIVITYLILSRSSSQSSETCTVWPTCLCSSSRSTCSLHSSRSS